MERLIKKLSMTCRSHLDEESEKQKQKEIQEKINGKVTWLEGIKMPFKCLTFFVSSFVYVKQIGIVTWSAGLFSRAGEQIKCIKLCSFQFCRQDGAFILAKVVY